MSLPSPPRDELERREYLASLSMVSGLCEDGIHRDDLVEPENDHEVQEMIDLAIESGLVEESGEEISPTERDAEEIDLDEVYDAVDC